MSLGVGIQSVIFYVLSCSACSKISHRHKAKVEAKRERAEKQKLETDQPGLYHHPSPFNTNPFWDEEITLGPGPPSRKNGSKNTSSRALHTAGNASSIAASVAPSSQAPSSPTIVPEDQRLSGDDWNRKRYQREDEELWGVDTIKAGQRRVRDAFATAQVSVGSKLRAMEERLGKFGAVKEEDSHPYYVSRNPPVNDLHPPVVSSHPFQKGGMRWMMQPPPSASVMSGKQHPSASSISIPRSRSGSRASTLPPSTPNLNRQVTGRVVEEKLRRGETPSDAEMRVLSRHISGAKTLSSAKSLEPLQKVSRTRSYSSSDAEDESEAPSPSRAGNGLKGEENRQGKLSPIFSAAAQRRMSQDSIEDVPVAGDGGVAPAASGSKKGKGERRKKESSQRERPTSPQSSPERLPLGSLGQETRVQSPPPAKLKGEVEELELELKIEETRVVV
ncbi:hypothetical protein VF21_07470 [Pseudogymnoascus sp. 05NY08]|nr:hypothetical protein VF21_07470 [Pseudogymnoascus sp. 05NY08]